MLCHSPPAALPLYQQLLHCSQSACSSQLSPLAAVHALLGKRRKKKIGFGSSKKNPVKIIIKFQRKLQTSVKQLNEFLGCKVQSPKHLTRGGQITLELHVLQVQTGDPGSGTEAHNLNRFIGCFCPHSCQKGRKEEVEQQQYLGQLCGR